MLALLQLILAPVVMISACGLLCLALYNRLASIVSRARAFHHERFEVQMRLTRLAGDRAETEEAARLGDRLGLLDSQVGQILARAARVRNALTCLLATVLCMLGCSLLLGVTVVQQPRAAAAIEPQAFAITSHAGVLAVAVFVLGILFMMLGIVLAMLELRRALDPVAVEHHAFDRRAE